MAKQYDILLRLLVVGDSGVGKTCLLCKYVDEAFQPNYAATIGIDFKVKTINLHGQSIRVQIWDTAGQERFETITKQYYRRAQGALLVYDMTNEASYRHIVKWLAYLRQYAREDIELTLVGNKMDLRDFRQVPKEEAVRFAQTNGLAFYESSSFTDDQISQIYEDLVSRILRNQADEIRKQKVEQMPSDYDSDHGGDGNLMLNRPVGGRPGERPKRDCCANV